MKPCPVPACGHQIAGSMLMCASHWTRVPGPVQTAVCRAWRGVRQGEAGAADRYGRARAQAIAAVAPRGQYRSDVRQLEARL